MKMKMWALIDKEGNNFGVRFQQDDLPFGGTYMAEETLQKFKEQDPERGWHLELQDK